jgi:dTDP-4-dehydrorhamnose reductase
MTWVVTGANGQLGLAFRRALSNDLVCFAGRSSCDLGDPASLAAFLEHEQPSVIINCAAYTAVDAAEGDETTTTRVNADAVGEMARWAASTGALMVHFSTDYVFDGNATTAYFEDSLVNPLSAYGRSKATGEAQFLESGVKGMCLRTSWVHSNDCSNFLLTMKKLMQERDHLRIVDDQLSVPTTTDFLVYITLNLIELCQQSGSDVPRLIHAVPEGKTSWFGFASHIRERLIQQDSTVRLATLEPILSSEFAQAAIRPKYSVMSNALLQSHLGKPVNRWEAWHDKLYGE